MSTGELRRAGVLARVESGELHLADAARLMELSYRQAKRLWKRFRKGGAEGLKHGNGGRPSNRAYEEEFRVQVLKLVREKYSGAPDERFGPTLAAEHLASGDGQKIARETLRRWMMAEGLWSRERKRREHRQRRERREHFGEMVQMDGSFHAWLEDRGPGGCLMDLVDDATNTTLASLGEEETIWAAADALRAWMERYGVPHQLYVDWKNLYKRVATPKERLRGEEPVTQFGRMCEKLGIKLIAANSPQAKGRVERVHGTHQDRLVKKLRLKGIASHAEANAYLESEYLEEHNQRFKRMAKKPEDYHHPCPGAAELEKIFRLETERTISDDWVVRYHGRFFQLEPESQHYAPARGKVLVGEARDGRVTIEYRGRAVPWRELLAEGRAEALQAKPEIRPAVASPAPMKRKWVPPVDHPWRVADRKERRKRALARELAAAGASLAFPCASP